MAIERSIRINVEAGRAKAELRSLQGSLRDTDRAAGAAATASRALGAAIAGFASVATIRQVASYADTYTNLQNQLRLVTNSTEQLASSTDALFSIANRTRNSFEGTADLYARLARSTEELGVSNERLLSVTETVNQAIAVSGTNAASANAALFQLGQGLGSGALRGEELNSVLEQTPRLAKAIADGLGVSIAQLRELGQEGELTAERVFNALESQSDVLRQEYGQTSSTIEQAFTKINNELIKYIGEADKANNITKSVTGTLEIFANNFSEIADTAIGVFVPALEAASFVIASRLIGGIASSTKAKFADIAATKAHSNAILENTKFDANKARTSELVAAAVLRKAKADQAATLATKNHSNSVIEGLEADSKKAQIAEIVSIATLNKAKSEETATLAALNNIKAVQSQLLAERELEVVRLKSQITEKGRQLSLTRLAEIRQAEKSILTQVTAAEIAHSEAIGKTTVAYNAYTVAATAARDAQSVEEKAKLTAAEIANADAAQRTSSAYTSYVVASSKATKATRLQSIAIKANTVAARAGTVAINGFKSAIAFLGGPVGVAITAATAIGFYAASLESAEEKTERIRRETDEFINSLENASIIQFTTALFNAEEAADAARSELDKANNELNRLVSVGAESSKVTEELRVKISQLEANVVNAEQEVNKISNTFQDAAQSAREFAGAASGEDNTKNPELLAAAYKKLKGELDEATKIQNEFEETIKQINKDFPEGEKNIELVRLAEKKRDEDLKRLNDRTKKAAERNAKLHRSYADLRGEFDPLAKISFEYQEILKEIDQSTASVSEKETLRALAAKQLRENLDDAIVTGQEFLAQFDSIASAEVRRIDLLKQLEKVQASASEKQALAAEIQRQYNKELDDAIPSFTELNAQFSAADAATVAYVDTLKQLDEAQRLGVDVTELRVNALKAYKKAAEEARKQDILNTETSQSFFGALLQGLNDSVQTADSSFDQIREVGRGAIDDLSTAITDFVATGEFNFRSFAANVINELLRIQTQALLLEGLDFFKNLGGDSEDGGFLQAAGSALGGLFGGGEEDTSATEPLNLGSLFGGESFGGEDQSAMFRDNWLNSIGEVGTAFDETFQNAIAQSDAFGSSTESAAASIGTSLVSSLIKMGTQLLTNATIGQTAQATIAATGATTASTLAAAWAPAAAATSLASFGANAVPATAGITSTYALTQTLSSAGALTGGKFARGGVMDIGEFSNQIVSTPTKFAAGGTVNQMGEAGAEAILPLQRTAGGELGVNASGMAAPTQPNVNVDVPVQVINVTERPQDYLTSDAGVRQIINIVNQNRDAIA